MGRRLQAPLLLSLPIALVVGWWIYRSYQEHKRGLCEAILSQMVGALRNYQTDHGTLPPELSAISKPEGKSYFQYTENGKVMPQILDPWGHPFVYRVRELGSYHARPIQRFELYSIGPNGKDEGGSGDDIATGN